MVKKRKKEVEVFDEAAHRRLTGVFFGIMIAIFIIVMVVIFNGKSDTDDSRVTFRYTDVELYDMALKEQDSKYCAEIRDTGKKDACFAIIKPEQKLSEDDLVFDKAVKEQNPDYCNNIQDLAKQEACLARFKITEDPNNDLYYRSEAIKNNDVSLCYKIVDTGKKEACVAFFT